MNMSSNSGKTGINLVDVYPIKYENWASELYYVMKRPKQIEQLFHSRVNV